MNQDQIYEEHLNAIDMVNEMDEVNENYGNNMKETKYTREYMKCTKFPPKEPMFKRECVMVALESDCLHTKCMQHKVKYVLHVDREHAEWVVWTLVVSDYG